MRTNPHFLSLIFLIPLIPLISCYKPEPATDSTSQERVFNGPYSGPYLHKVAFPIGGIGAGMICLEGTGSISHLSVRNKMEFAHVRY